MLVGQGDDADSGSSCNSNEGVTVAALAGQASQDKDVAKTICEAFSRKVAGVGESAASPDNTDPNCPEQQRRIATRVPAHLNVPMWSLGKRRACRPAEWVAATATHRNQP